MEKEKSIESVRVDPQTGEILDTYYYGDKIDKTTAETIEFLKRTITINEGKKYTMSIDSTFRLLGSYKLKGSSYSVLLVMLSCLGFGWCNNYVIKLENKRFSGFMNGKEIRAMTGLSESAFDSAISQLEEKEIIKKIPAVKGSGNNFIVNPFIACHSQRIPIEIFKMFEDSPFNYTKQSSQIDSKELQKKIKEEKEYIKELEEIIKRKKLQRLQSEMSTWGIKPK